MDPAVWTRSLSVVKEKASRSEFNATSLPGLWFVCFPYENQHKCSKSSTAINFHFLSFCFGMKETWEFPRLVLSSYFIEACDCVANSAYYMLGINL